MRCVCLTALLALLNAAPARAAGDQFLSGSASLGFATDIGATHADTVGAITHLEDHLWPSLARAPGTVQALGDTRLLRNMLQVPANLSGTGQDQGITTFPYGTQAMDVWSASAAVGYRAHAWSLYYSGAFVGTHSSQIDAPGAYPFAAAGLMGLGLAEAALAPLTTYRSSKLAAPYTSSAAHYIVGAAVHYDDSSLRLAYVGGGPAGLMASLAYEPWSLSATLVVDASSGVVPFVRLGLIRSAAPARTVFGPDVGACAPEDHCVVTPLTSLYARAYTLSVPQPGAYTPLASPRDAALWTVHLEQLNIPLPLGYLDARLALGATPSFFLHEAMLGWHSPTFHGGSTQSAGLPPLDMGISVGYAQMPTLRYAGTSGDGAFSFAAELRWGTWITGGIRRNAADALALYPFASSSTEVFVTLTQDAFTP